MRCACWISKAIRKHTRTHTYITHLLTPSLTRNMQYSFIFRCNSGSHTSLNFTFTRALSYLEFKKNCQTFIHNLWYFSELKSDAITATQNCFMSLLCYTSALNVEMPNTTRWIFTRHFYLCVSKEILWATLKRHSGYLLFQMIFRKFLSILSYSVQFVLMQRLALHLWWSWGLNVWFLKHFFNSLQLNSRLRISRSNKFSILKLQIFQILNIAWYSRNGRFMNYLKNWKRLIIRPTLLVIIQWSIFFWQLCITYISLYSET
jgi:hypothetical protein